MRRNDLKKMQKKRVVKRKSYVDQDNDDEYGDELDEFEAPPPPSKPIKIKRRVVTKPRQKIDPLPVLVNLTRNNATTYQNELDQWRKNVLGTFRNVPISDFRDVTMVNILKGFDISTSGERHVLEWRLKRLFDGKPNVKSQSSVLGACFREPPPRTSFTNINLYISFSGSSWKPVVDNRILWNCWKNILDNILLAKLDVADLFSFMYTCKFFYNIVNPFLCVLAQRRFDPFGTPIALSCEMYFKWVKKHNFLGNSQIRERLGMRSGASYPKFDEIMWRNTGYIDYLKQNELLLFEQGRAKRIEFEYAERTKQTRLSRLNTAMTEAGFGYLSFRHPGATFEFESRTVQTTCRHDDEAKLVLSFAKDCYKTETFDASQLQELFKLHEKWFLHAEDVHLCAYVGIDRTVLHFFSVMESLANMFYDIYKTYRRFMLTTFNDVRAVHHPYGADFIYVFSASNVVLHNGSIPMIMLDPQIGIPEREIFYKRTLIKIRAKFATLQGAEIIDGCIGRFVIVQ